LSEKKLRKEREERKATSDSRKRSTQKRRARAKIGNEVEAKIG